MFQENDEVGLSVVTLEVTDDDLDPNGPPFLFDLVDGNEANKFHINSNGTVMTAATFNRQIKDEYELTVRVFDSGEPTLHTDMIVVVKIVEESAFPPVVTPLAITMSTFNDEFPGGAIGRVKAIDPDPYDIVRFSIVSDDDEQLFGINQFDGTLEATESIDAGLYNINVSITDDKYIVYSQVNVTVQNIDTDMAENGVVIRFTQLLPEEFIANHRVSFLRAVARELAVTKDDVLILSIQAASDTVASPENALTRKKRSTDANLDVLIAVRKSKNRFFRSRTLRRQLSRSQAALEQATGLEIERVFDNVCSRDSCVAGECETIVHFLTDQVLTILTDRESYSSARHLLGYRCVCEAGYGGGY